MTELSSRRRALVRDVSLSTLMSPKPEDSSCLSRIVESDWFINLTVAVIIANLVQVIIQADQEARTLNADIPVHKFLGTCFTVYYVVELSLKLMVYKTEFFCGNEMLFNCFDFILVMA